MRSPLNPIEECRQKVGEASAYGTTTLAVQGSFVIVQMIRQDGLEAYQWRVNVSTGFGPWTVNVYDSFYVTRTTRRHRWQHAGKVAIEFPLTCREVLEKVIKYLPELIEVKL